VPASTFFFNREYRTNSSITMKAFIVALLVALPATLAAPVAEYVNNPPTPSYLLDTN
jgi:hypothetical protein